MKLATFVVRGDASAEKWGVLNGERLIDVQKISAVSARGGVAEALGSVPSIKALLELDDGLGMLRDFYSTLLAGDQIADEYAYDVVDVRFLPPIPWPGKFLCVGKNNRKHLEELLNNDLLTEMPKEPTGFIKLQHTLVGDGADVARPRDVIAFDYEPELAFVIGKGGIRISQDEALGHVAGITLFNDLTDRDIQKREVASGTRFWTAKNMPGFGPIGPYLITMDEIEDPHDLWFTLTVNGEQRIRFNTGDYIFQIPQIIEHFSRHLAVEPGDVFASGAPGGVAVGKPNAAELYLKPGDTVVVGLEGVADLTTHIV